MKKFALAQVWAHFSCVLETSLFRCYEDDGISKLFNRLIILTLQGHMISRCQVLLLLRCHQGSPVMRGTESLFKRSPVLV